MVEETRDEEIVAFDNQSWLGIAFVNRGATDAKISTLIIGDASGLSGDREIRRYGLSMVGDRR